ncbi:MAG: ATP-binding protein [Cyanobacteria bacterium SID2]|nr:ATP-binding protein [Cyanobacteria bacterium SID2]MBP0005410.1 ATP-binding protein [Cyanobacteria bacterium SBC]
MNTTSIRFLQHQAASLLLYQSVLTDEVGLAFLGLLDTLYHGNKPTDCLYAYGRWFKALSALGKSWQSHLIDRILFDDNPFSRQVQQHPLETLAVPLVAAAKHDLQALQHLYNCDSETLSQWVRLVTKSEKTPVAVPKTTTPHPVSLPEFASWGDALPQLADYHRRHGAGLFARYRALRWEAETLQGIPHPDPVRLADLAGYNRQKTALIDNVKVLLAGYPTLHVLLYGCRGSGKSSLVKAVANEFADRNLRLVEVAKSDLRDLPSIVEQLRDLPQKSILFVDDLSFEEDDEAFKALKVVLEGGATARASNVVVYATSNRRHLVREFFEDRPRPGQGDEVHAWDTVQEKLSFSDRFGLHLTFEPTNQDTYLEIVRHLAGKARLDISIEALDARALQWATQHNGRSGRTARQFIDFLQAELALSPPDVWS